MYLEAIDSFDHVLKNKPHHIPSLKEKIEAYMAFGKELYELGSFEASAQQFLNGIHICIYIIDKIQSDLHFIYKLLGDCLLKIVLHVPGRVHVVDLNSIEFCLSFEKRCQLLFKDLFHSSNLSNDLSNEFTKDFTKKNLRLNSSEQVYTLLKCALSSYSMATLSCFDLNLQSFYLYDMSLVFYKMYCLLSVEYVESLEFEESLKSLEFKELEKAIKSAKYSLLHSKQSHLVWNALGIYSSKSNPILSQHAFIKALECKPRPSYWSNLGYFYLFHSDLECSRECFSHSQLLDPEWPSSWLGKALIAHSCQQMDEYHDFIQHGQELTLGTWKELNYLYSENVILSNKQNTSPIQAEEQLAKAILFLRQSKNHFITNPKVWNGMGILFERVKEYQESINAFEMGLESCLKTDPIHSILLSNYGRVLYSLKRYQDSLNVYNQVCNPSPEDKLVEALDHFHLSNVSAVLECFEESIALSGENMSLINTCLVTLGQVLYSLKIENSIELSKEQFFQW